MSLPAFVHRYVPPQGGSSRTLLLLHGGEGDENGMIALGEEIAPDAGLLSPRGNALDDGKPRFFRRFADAGHDVSELRRRTDELADFVRWAAENYGFDPLEVLAVGRANGASVAASVLVHRPEALAGGALLRATAPYAPNEPPVLWGKRVFLGGIENDPLLPIEETTRLHTLLNRYGAEVRTAWFSNGEELLDSEARAAAAWVSSL